MPLSMFFQSGQGRDHFYLASSDNNIKTFFSSVDFLNKGSIDEVYPFLNPNFDNFQLSDSVINMITMMPPLNLQFGSYFVNNPSRVLLHQKIQDINSLNPLISFENIDKRIGIND